MKKEINLPLKFDSRDSGLVYLEFYKPIILCHLVYYVYILREDKILKK